MAVGTGLKSNIATAHSRQVKTVTPLCINLPFLTRCGLSVGFDQLQTLSPN